MQCREKEGKQIFENQIKNDFKNFCNWLQLIEREVKNIQGGIQRLIWNSFEHHRCRFLYDTAFSS